MTSSETDKIIAALIKAREKFGPVAKNRTNPHYKSKFADLSAIKDAIDKPLADQGLAVVQLVQGMSLITRLYHTSGQFFESSYPLNPVKNDPQGWGSAVTYARRYAISALLGIVADEDDDGNAGSEIPPPTRKEPVRSSGDEIRARELPPPADSSIARGTVVAASTKEVTVNGAAKTSHAFRIDSEWYSTLDEKEAEKMYQAKEDKMPRLVYYKLKGKFRNIITSKKVEAEPAAESEPEIEEVPF